MILTITAYDADGNGDTSGSFPIDYTLTTQDQPYDSTTWWTTIGIPVVIGSSDIVDTIIRFNNEGDEQHPSWWQVYQQNNFTTSSMAVSQEILFNFDEHTFVHEEAWSTDIDPHPVFSISPVVDIIAYLSNMAYAYQGSTADDTFDFSSINPSVFAVGGLAHGAEGADILTAGMGPDQLYGGAGDDTITGGAGDYLDGGADNDIIEGVSGATMVGGTGSDLLRLNLISLESSLSLKLADQVSAAVQVADNTSIEGFETIRLYTGSGNDTLDMRGFTFEQHASNSENSFFDLSTGTDTIFVSDTAKGNATIYGADHLNADFSAASAGVSISGDGVFTANGDLSLLIEFNQNYPGNNRLTSITATGGAGDDTLSGVDGNDTLKGGAGDDTITGGAGDYLDGGADNDIIEGVSGATMVGGTGSDLLRLNLISLESSLSLKLADQVSAAVQVADNTSIEGFETIRLYTGSGNDTLDMRGFTFEQHASNSENSFFDLSTGTDTIFVSDTAKGNATIYGADHLNADFSAASAGVSISGDGVFTANGDLSLLIEFNQNYPGNNRLTSITATGGAGDDTLSGVDGNDTLKGGAGDDTITGGAGLDTAVYDGKFSDYDVDVLAHTISSALEGTDTLADIELARFSNGVFDFSSGHFTKEINSAPQGIALSRSSVSEDTPVWTTLALLHAFDADGDTLTYKLIDGSDDHFRIKGNRLVSSKEFDFETQSEHVITVGVSDGTETVLKNFKISVTDIYELSTNLAPTNLSFSRTSIKENIAVGTSVGLFNAIDPEGATLKWRLADDADGTFRLVGHKLMTAKNIDYEHTPTLDITLEVTDNFGNASTKDFTLHVQDIYEPQQTMSSSFDLFT